MVIKDSQVRDSEVERLIETDIREMRKILKDKDRQRDVEAKIRRDTEYENSSEGVLDSLRVWSEATSEDEKNKDLIAETHYMREFIFNQIHSRKFVIAITYSLSAIYHITVDLIFMR